MRLALKAQSQCRTTIETLTILKNPTTIFARQANIAQGSQQVNNAQVNTAVAVLERGTPDTGIWESGPTHGRLPHARGKIWAEQTIVVRGWTQARRVWQAAAIRQWRPWEQATGPRTPAGKARVARNADRGGQRRRERVMMQALRAGLSAQKDALGRIVRVQRSRAN